jgi:hypothetical protein
VQRAAREAFTLRNAPLGRRSDLSDLEHVVLLAAPHSRMPFVRVYFRETQELQP